MSSVDLRTLLSEPTRIRALTQCVRAKIPTHDVDDVVQSTLTDALSAACPPLDVPALDRWLVGIARHKVADYYRSQRRERADGDIDGHNVAADSHPESTRDLLHWVHGELRSDSEAPRTLEWMMREADGDRLESIAEENNISAPAVRQRVSRLRRYLRERWLLQLSAAVTLVALAVGVYAYHQRGPTVEPEPMVRVDSPAQVAERLRQAALADCRSARWQACLQQLDRAKILDPAGDRSSAIIAARTDIERGLQPTPVPAPSASDQRLVPAGKEPNTLESSPQKAPRPLHSQSIKSSGKKQAISIPQPAANQATSNVRRWAPAQPQLKPPSKPSSLDQFGM